MLPNMIAVKDSAIVNFLTGLQTAERLVCSTRPFGGAAE